MRWNSCALPSQIVGMRIIVDDVRRELEFQTIWCDFGVAKANESAHISAVSFSYFIPFFIFSFVHILRLHCSMRLQILFSHCSIHCHFGCVRSYAQCVFSIILIWHKYDKREWKKEEEEERTKSEIDTAAKMIVQSPSGFPILLHIWLFVCECFERAISIHVFHLFVLL